MFTLFAISTSPAWEKLYVQRDTDNLVLVKDLDKLKATLIFLGGMIDTIAALGCALVGGLALGNVIVIHSAMGAKVFTHIFIAAASLESMPLMACFAFIASDVFRHLIQTHFPIPNLID